MNNTVINAHGQVHVAECARCGQSLSHPLWLGNKAYGADCFEVITGLRADSVTKWTRNGVVDLEARQQEITAMQQAQAQQVARVQQITAKNQWLINHLEPYAIFVEGSPSNFFASIIASLRNGELASELSVKAQNIILDTLSREAGRAGSKKYNTRREQLEAAIELTVLPE